jgi:hypothetical protein
MTSVHPSAARPVAGRGSGVPAGDPTPEMRGADGPCLRIFAAHTVPQPDRALQSCLTPGNCSRYCAQVNERLMYSE